MSTDRVYKFADVIKALGKKHVIKFKTPRRAEVCEKFLE